MNKKSFFTGLFSGILVAVLIAAISFGIVYYKNNNMTDSSSAIDYTSVEAKLHELEVYVNRYYLNEDKIKADNLEDGICKGYLDAIGDKYAAYYNKEETKEMNNFILGKYEGIGVVVSQNPDTKAIYITNIFEESGAEKAGLKVEDQLLRVGDTDIATMDLTKAVTYIRGDKGTEVNIVIYRAGKGEMEFTIERSEIDIPSVSQLILNNNIGYIEISQFEENTVQQFEEAYNTLLESNVDGIIIDLRGNPGGLLDSVVSILGHFIPNDGLAIYTENKYGKRENEYTKTINLCKIPVAVLINQDSASASEIFAGAIQDYKTGIVVGTTSFGKGVVQNMMELPDGSSLKLTISKYFTPKGRDIDGKGITPDVEVELNEIPDDKQEITEEDDNQLQAAKAEIEKMLK